MRKLIFIFWMLIIIITVFFSFLTFSQNISSNNVIFAYTHSATIELTDTMYVEIAFSEPMSYVGLLNINNYNIKDLIDNSYITIYGIQDKYSINNIARNVDNKIDTLLLKTSKHIHFGSYELKVNNVKDLANNLIDKNTVSYILLIP